MGALHLAVQQGKALYAGISNYSAEQTREAVRILGKMGTPLLIHQPKYSMFVRWVEEGLLDVLAEKGVGCIPFSPLAQGLLTNRYLDGIPQDSRAAKSWGFLNKEEITESTLRKIKALNVIAGQRGQSLAQMALAWVLRRQEVTTVLIGASSIKQLDDNIETLNTLHFDKEELLKIEEILARK